MHDLDPRLHVSRHAIERYRERINPDATNQDAVAAMWTAAVRRTVFETIGTEKRVLVRCGASTVFVVGGCVVTVIIGSRHSFKTRRYVPDRERRPNAWKHRVMRDLVNEGAL